MQTYLAKEIKTIRELLTKRIQLAERYLVLPNVIMYRVREANKMDIISLTMIKHCTHNKGFSEEWYSKLVMHSTLTVDGISHNQSLFPFPYGFECQWQQLQMGVNLDTILKSAIISYVQQDLYTFGTFTRKPTNTLLTILELAIIFPIHYQLVKL